MAICTEMVPGNTADVTVLLPVVDRLRTRFGVTRACVVADRGMISADTIAALEKLGMEYILGARERSSSVIHNLVLYDTAPMVPLVLERQRGETVGCLKPALPAMIPKQDIQLIRRETAALSFGKSSRLAFVSCRCDITM